MISTTHSYCPKCFNTSLDLKTSGKVYLYFDGKKKESSLFIYNLENDFQDEINTRLVSRIDDFFRWYGNFDHKMPIKKVEALSPDFKCLDGCSIESNFQPSVVGILFDQKFFESSVRDLASTHGVELDF